jgi:hypothetical protein
MRQMKTSEKPRDVSGVELLMNNHQVKGSSVNYVQCILPN